MSAVLAEAIRTVLSLAVAHSAHEPILRQMHAEGADIFSRANVSGHVTVSACLFDRSLSRVLMIDAQKFNRRLLPGGHIDAGECPLEAAARELSEECGIQPHCIELLEPRPVSMNVHWIEANPERCELKHLHFDVHVLFRSVSESLNVSVDMREASNAGWFNLNNLTASYPELSNYISRGRLNG